MSQTHFLKAGFKKLLKLWCGFLDIFKLIIQDRGQPHNYEK